MKSFISLATSFFLLVVCSTSYAQLNLTLDAMYGKEKLMVTVGAGKKLNNLVIIGGYVKGGSLVDYRYPTVNYVKDEFDVYVPTSKVPEFPYGPDESARFMSGTTRTKGWAVGVQLYLSRALGNAKKDWFFIRFNLEHLRLTDEYDFVWSKLVFPGEPEVIIEDRGKYNYHSIGIGTKAGYKRFLDRKNNLFAQINLGVSYYHPYYPQENEIYATSYTTTTPFLGVEFEGELGIGYQFGK